MKELFILLLLSLATTLQAGDCCAAKAKQTAAAAVENKSASCPYLAEQNKSQCPAMPEQTVASDEQKLPECKNEKCSKEKCQSGCACGETCHGQKTTIAAEEKPACDKEKCCPKDGAKCEKACCLETTEKQQKNSASA